jgi:hypothetical protein
VHERRRRHVAADHAEAGGSPAPGVNLVGKQAAAYKPS